MGIPSRIFISITNIAERDGEDLIHYIIVSLYKKAGGPARSLSRRFLRA